MLGLKKWGKNCRMCVQDKHVTIQAMSCDKHLSHMWAAQVQVFFFSFGFYSLSRLSQSLGGAKTGDPQEKPTDHSQADFGLSHVTQARLEHIAVRWRGI